jgi:hypothetical protein
LKAETAASKTKPSGAKTALTKTAKATKAPVRKAAKDDMSDEGRAKIAAAQAKRWGRLARRYLRANVG